ncbi:unnamed protein product [Mytilus edulis]|uniref:Reverse transcriptase domain-containing protein n=1 Tax=Mytilus edulis TaxID=6550 RepID=A0A8S3UI87_MYTED|nr:unnamed protein product [Mytilus edulis]
MTKDRRVSKDTSKNLQQDEQLQDTYENDRVNPDHLLPFTGTSEEFSKLLSTGTYESFENRVFLCGSCACGKSTLASVLIGSPIPLTWKSTDGLVIHFGRNGINLETFDMVPLHGEDRCQNVLTKVVIGKPTRETSTCQSSDTHHDKPFAPSPMGTDSLESNLKAIQKENSNSCKVSQSSDASLTESQDLPTTNTSSEMKKIDQKRPEQTTAKPTCSSELNKTTNRIDPKVINLSSTKLDNSQIDLLIKGFKFTPTPTPNTTILKSDIQQFSRRLRLREYFGNGKFDDGSLVRNKSTFTPNTGRDEYLDSFIDTISKLPINYHNTKQNLSRREKKSLEELKNNPSIILKEADKGGGIVIMDKTFYREKVLEQLNDNEYYTKLRKNNDKSTIRKIKRLVKEYSESFTANEIAYLCDFTPKEANFYGLPKIHKSNTIQTAVKHQNKKYIESPNPSDLKLRPIVAGPESPTQRMSHFLDLILKKLCPLIPSYVRDDIDFLRYIPETVPKNTLLTTFDVTSLYTNIPHDLGTTAIKYWVEINREIVDGRFDTELIVKALKIILEGNIFYFDGLAKTILPTTPSEQHLSRFADQLSNNSCRKLMIHLGLQLKDWEDIETATEGCP